MNALAQHVSSFFQDAFIPLHSWTRQKLEDSCLEADVALHSWKTGLFGKSRGVVLEIGAGSGINRKYFGHSVTYLALEPERIAFQQVNAVAEAAYWAVAESIPLPDESVDCVICSMSLCSVKDLSLTLDEVHRVLRPNGRLLVIEHIGAPKGSWMHFFQRLFRPVCQHIEGGCCPDRDTTKALRSSRLVMEDFMEFQLKLKGPLIHDWVAASLVKADAS